MQPRSTYIRWDDEHDPIPAQYADGQYTIDAAGLVQMMRDCWDHSPYGLRHTVGDDAARETISALLDLPQVGARFVLAAPVVGEILETDSHGNELD